MKQFHYYSETLLIKKNKAKVVEIGSIANNLYIGSEVTKAQLGTGDYPTIKCGDVNSGLPACFYECISFVDESLIKTKRYFEHGDVLIGKIGNAETSGQSVAYLGKNKCLLGDAVYALKHSQSPQYLAYVLRTKFVRKQIKSFCSSGTVFNLYKSAIKKIQIPLPSLEEQQQIVDKLDVIYECLENIKLKVPQLISLQKQRLQYYINKFTSL